MKYLNFTIIIIALIVVFSCRKDFSTVENYGNLSFSKDTVYLDTVFTNISSATFNLKVYNNSNKHINIPSIALENGEDSNYRLNVDGIPGKEFEDIDILANDSLYIFIETTIDFDLITDPLYIDRILFDNGNNQQDVDLVTLVQDATFIFPERDPFTLQAIPLELENEKTLSGRFLNNDELIFTNERPYVIYGYAAVPSEQTLTIEAGARIHFHNNSGLIVDTDASLKINGTLDEKVTFEGDRLEFDYSDIPGQWGTIWLRDGSIDNEINHTQIRNGSIGILVEKTNDTSVEPILKINNSEIYNNSTYGILGKQTNIEGTNLVIGSAGQSSFAGIAGGNYNFTHCTFANYWKEGVRTSSTVFISNTSSTFNEDNQELSTNTNDLNQANFTNCIIEGGRTNELSIIKDDTVSTIFEFNISNCLIRSDLNSNNELINFDDTSHYQDNIINGNPDFKNSDNNEFLIGQESDAINGGVLTSISSDILNTLRIPNIDIGTYQSTNIE